ncbi:IS5 family transposase [Halorarum salinum]|uniref:IS5 family transposase n=1 Tax=Halorarum salinum TaxID=2743089 RepID=A0A7D5QAN1_9EURY|nr:IS5 family transposase [Halobaculum salinum]QLG61898.1 IS5 family transposase [Halobaculum salinum]
MDALSKSQLLRFVERAMVLARRAVARFSTRYSRKRFTLRQRVVSLCLKVKKTITYRDLVDELIEMPRIRDALNLNLIPAPTTRCKAFDRLEMAVWRVLLNVSLADLPVNGVTGIDASGFERAHTSAHYTKRTNLTIQQLKTTLLVDTATNAVLDIHVTTTRKHDTQIAPQVAKRNAASIAVLTGDKGYDDQKLRRLARDHDIRPLIKHREFTPLHKAWNTRLDSDLYHRRNMNETVNAAIKLRFGAFVRSRRWWKQFRELVLKCVVHNLERSLAISRDKCECP